MSDSVAIVDKALMATGAMDVMANRKREGARGIQVYNVSQLLGASGYVKDGSRLQSTYEAPYFILTISERIDIYRLCSPIFGVITGRMNRIAGMEWHVTCEKTIEDKLAEEMKTLYAVYKEYEKDFDMRSIGIKVRASTMIMKRLPEVKADLSNFQSAILRWSRKIKAVHEEEATEIEQWLKMPNQGQTFVDFIKTVVADLHIHGVSVPYKQFENKRLENIYVLPGGSVFPLRGRFVGDSTGYIQIVNGFDPLIMFKDEIAYLQYAPRSDNSYGSIPLEALVNKVAESIMFDQRAAEMSDGTKPPEKLIAFGEQAPLGELGSEFELPLPKDEQKRIETLVNESRKEAIRIISGVGSPVVVDVSRADTFGQQNERQRMVREEVGLVFSASAIEMNLAGGDNTSGRNTSETQERYDLYKGTYPIIQTIENMINNDILPFRTRSGFIFKYEPTISESEQVKLFSEKIMSGVFSVNEIRVDDLGKDPFQGEEFDKPQGAQQAQPGAEANPMYTKGV